MTIIISKDSPQQDIKRQLEAIKPVKKFDPYKHLIKVHLTESPVEIQKKLRDEWE